MALENRRTNRSACLEQFSSSIVKVSLEKKNSMSLGLVVFEEKLFTLTHTPQSDAIMSADIKIASEMPVPHSLGKYFEHHKIQKFSTEFRILSEHCQLYKGPNNV